MKTVRPSLKFWQNWQSLLMVGFATVGLLAADLTLTYHREIDFANRETQNISRVLDEHLNATISKIDIALNSAVFELGPLVQRDTQANNRRINERLLLIQKSIPESQSLRIVNSAGNVIYDASGKLPSGNIADRPYFQENLKNPSAGLIISEPVFSRFTKVWVITFTRQIRGPRGEFIGIIMAAIRAEYFERFYQTLNLGTNGLISLMNKDYVIFARHPSKLELLGTQLKGTEAEKLILAGKNTGFYQSRSLSDKHPRLHYFQKSSKGNPFIFVVGMSVSNILKDFYRKTAIYLIFCLLMLTSLTLIQRKWRNQNQISDAEADELRQALLDNSAVGIILTTTDRNIEQASQRMCQMFGYTHAEILHQSTEIIHIDHQHFDAFRKNYDRLLNEFLVGSEYPFRHKDGHVFWCSVSGTALDPENPAKGIIWSFLDIDERRRLGVEVEIQKKNLNDILNNIPAAVSFWDCQDLHNIFNVFSNRTYADWYETTSEALVGMHVRDLLGEKIYNANWDKMVKSAQGETLVYDRIQPSINGQAPRHAQIHYIPDMVGNHARGLYVMMFDTTSIRQSEMAMKDAKEVAENATRAKSEFLANMSHEIRTPMNAIIGLTGMALETHLNTRQRDYLNKVHNAAKALLSLLNDILDYSKIEAGRLTLEHTPFELQRSIRDIEDLFLIRLEEKKLGWRVKIEDGIPQNLVGDPLRLGQILINLIANAVKFTDQGEISLHIKAENETLESVTLQFCISDTGIGMTPEQTEIIFGSFTQADSTVTRKYGGTGLGLSIVKQLVEMMGGEIVVKSTVGTGSHFCFTTVFQKTTPLQDATLDTQNRAAIDFEAAKMALAANLPIDSEYIEAMPMRKLDTDDRDILKNRLNEVRDLLADNKFAARHIAEEIERLVAGTELEAKFKGIVTATRKLKFKQALTALDQFLETTDE